MRTVKNIIDSKPPHVNIISPDTLVIKALETLVSVNLSYLIVMEGEEFAGVFSERDYSRNVVLKGRSSNTTKVNEVMATDLPHVKLTNTVEECMNILNVNKARYLLAYDHDDKFVGVVTIHDLLRQVIFSKGQVFDSEMAQQLLDQQESGGEIY
jgi:CBS domain-containing protein